MHLKEFYNSGLEYSLAQIAGDRNLTIDIQKILIWIGLLETTSTGADGQFGPLTTEALREFQIRTKCPKVGTLDKATAKALIETSPERLPLPKIRSGHDFAGRVIKYMIAKGYNISQRPGTYNIVYVEGVESDGTENTDELNSFNDLRMVIQIDAMGVPKILGKWLATTEPGSWYTKHRMNEKGAARIKFGQYKAWQVGVHKQQNPALVQAANVTVHRDANEDGSRSGDALDTGDNFGINQHHANDAPRTDIGKWGAGCLVGRTQQGHVEFMNMIMQDWRYKQNQQYLFETAIIPGDDLNKMFPI
jgi:Putative peptidoglycan binding domain